MDDKFKQALDLLALVTGELKVTRADHQRLVDALNVLGEGMRQLNEMKSEQKPA